MTTKTSQTEYVTKSDLKEELSVFKSEFKKELIDEIKGVIRDSFESFAELLEPRFHAIESTMAKKSDIFKILDKTVPLHRFDDLSLRLHNIEQKIN